MTDDYQLKPVAEYFATKFGMTLVPHTESSFFETVGALRGTEQLIRHACGNSRTPTNAAAIAQNGDHHVYWNQMGSRPIEALAIKTPRYNASVLHDEGGDYEFVIDDRAASKILLKHRGNVMTSHITRLKDTAEVKTVLEEILALE
jgi:hypothetical protein